MPISPQKLQERKIRKVLQASGMYKETSEIIIQHAAQILVLLDQAKAELATKKELVQTFQTGARQISPELTNVRNLYSDFLNYAKNLGLTTKAAKELGKGSQVKQAPAKRSVMHLAKKRTAE